MRVGPKDSEEERATEVPSMEEDTPKRHKHRLEWSSSIMGRMAAPELERFPHSCPSPRAS